MANDPYPFTPDFEVAIINRVVASPVLLSRLLSFVRPERFNNPNVALLMEEAVDFFKQYERPPTPVDLLQAIRFRIESGKVAGSALPECAGVLDEGLDLPPAEIQFVIDKIALSERKRALAGALDDSWKLYRDGQYDEIVETFERANRIGITELTMGSHYLDTLDGRTEFRKSGKTPPRWGTGIPDLDDVIAGGLAKGELGCILGAPKFGKSSFLDFVAVHCMTQGGTVVFISLEMSEDAILDRVDAAISGIQLAHLSKKADDVRARVSEWMAKTGGSLVVKQFTPMVTSSRTISAYLQQLRVEKSIVPTMLVVDYGDLMTANSQQYDKRYEELGAVYTELRALAVEYQVPVWTASQANREALTQKTVTAYNIAESFKKVMISDVIIAICRTEEEKVNKQLRFYVSQCRYATDGVEVGPFSTAFEIGRIVG